jgi:hypothetical protein
MRVQNVVLITANVFNLKKLFETDEDGDFKNDRIVLVVFGLAILGAGLTEGML